MKYRLAAALLLALPSAALAQEETPAIAIEEPPAATVPACFPKRTGSISSAVLPRR